ncbi:MAG: peptidyl-prolyl cis-trans isomerase [Proteobacteria bacterium]|nr:peptidyl-prolyl cis-trans isomerase [Pseudomonadota bacterium]
MFESLRAVMREPLLHFLLAGAGLFLLFEIVSEPETTGDEQIIVTSGHIEHLASLFAKTWHRAPSDVELRGLIDSFILEEVLYREATAIGLDQDDTIIRRRLKQKMEFLVDDFSAAEPSDTDLQKFLDDNPDRFRIDARISFEHVYLVDADSNAIDAMLAALQSGEPLDPGAAVPSGLLPRRFADASETSIGGQFGDSFKNAVFALDVDQWTGPVESPFGVHLVKVEQIEERRVPSLAEIRNVVARDWLADRRRSAQEALFDQLKAKYSITIEEYVAPDL